MDCVRVKICGITTLEDALYSSSVGADALGFIFYAKSPRYITPEKAGSIIRELPPFITTVGVFVDMPSGDILKIMDTAGLDAAQLHGGESPQECAIGRKTIKAIRVKGSEDIRDIDKYPVSAVLLDAYCKTLPGGTGICFDWAIAAEAGSKAKRIILSGGLNPDNVAIAVRRARPYAVDASSGLEHEKGRKDLSKVKAFIENAKNALSQV